MSQPVKLSDSLVLDARLTSDIAERSIAGQIEFWARLGRAVEPLLSGEKALALRKSGDVVPLSTLFSSIDSIEGRRRLTNYLNRQFYPHYEPAPHRPGLLVRIEEDGTRAVGKFVNREFQPETSKKHSRKSDFKSQGKAKKRK